MQYENEGHSCIECNRADEQMANESLCIECAYHNERMANMQYKVWVLGVGETTYATNGLLFDSIEDARAWGDGLLMRWFGAECYVVLPDALPMGQGIDVVDCSPITQEFVDKHKVY